MTSRNAGIAVRTFACLFACIGVALYCFPPAASTPPPARIIAAPSPHRQPPAPPAMLAGTREITAPSPASVATNPDSDHASDPCRPYRLEQALGHAKALSASPDASASIYSAALVEFTNALGCSEPEEPDSLRQALEFSAVWGAIAHRFSAAQWAQERDPAFLENARQSSVDDCPAEQSDQARAACQAALYALRSRMPFSAEEGAAALAVDQLEAWRAIASATGSRETAAISRLRRWVEILGQAPRQERSRRLWAKTLLPIFAPDEAIE